MWVKAGARFCSYNPWKSRRFCSARAETAPERAQPDDLHNGLPLRNKLPGTMTFDRQGLRYEQYVDEESGSHVC
jgi:hypothetical protein